MSPTEIANLALSHLGSSKEIQALETENSAEARACRRFYEVARDAVLRDFDWPFATKIAALGLIEEEPNDEWAFSYRYPSDALFFRRIQSGTRNDDKATRVAYKIGQDNTGELIFTDKEDAVGEYTIRVTNTGIFTADFISALSLRLAAYAAPRITAGDPNKLGERALRLYAIEIAQARASASVEQQPDNPPESEFITSRE